jgi:hypothetical protein
LITVLYLHDGIGDFLSNGCVTAGLWKPSDVNEWHSFNPIQSTQIKSNQIKSNQIKSNQINTPSSFRTTVCVCGGWWWQKKVAHHFGVFLPSKREPLAFAWSFWDRQATWTRERTVVTYVRY